MKLNTEKASIDLGGVIVAVIWSMNIVLISPRIDRPNPTPAKIDVGYRLTQDSLENIKNTKNPKIRGIMATKFPDNNDVIPVPLMQFIPINARTALIQIAKQLNGYPHEATIYFVGAREYKASCIH